jgi:hypothetical protein
MTDDPVELDKHRGMTAQQQTKVRRSHLARFQAEREAMLARQEELENLLVAAPAETWTEAAAAAQYLIQLFAATSEAQDVRRKELIARTLEDLARLSDRASTPS